MSKSNSNIVFLFPLTRTTLFPGTTKPLNIFEPRYIQMVNEALETDTEIAIAYSEPDLELHRKQRGLTQIQLGEKFVFERISRICGSGRVHLLEKRKDDTMLILLEGSRKVRLLDVEVAVKPFMRATVEDVHEDTTLPTDVLKSYRELAPVFERWLKRMVPDQEAREIFLNKTQAPHERVNAMASLMLENPIDAQDILELNSTADRILQLHFLLNQAAPVH